MGIFGAIFGSSKSSSSSTSNTTTDRRGVADNGSATVTGDNNTTTVFSVDKDIAQTAIDNAAGLAALAISADQQKLAAVTDSARYAMGQSAALAQDMFANASGAMQEAVSDALGFARRGQESAFTLVGNTVTGALDFVNLNDQRAAESQRNATVQVASAFQAAGDLSTGNRYIITTGIVIIGIVGFMAMRGR